MRVLVYNTAAQEGGALFVLKNFYADVVERAPSYIQWHFIVSKDVLQSTENVEVSIFPQVKKSWLHRWYFEKYKLQEIIEKFNPDYIISLQNMPLMHVKRPQLVYLHQSLQYCPKKFSFFKKQERGLAIRQRIACRLYKRALPKAMHIFVQTNWIKRATLNWLKCKDTDVTVVPVKLNGEPIRDREYQLKGIRTFFYPARGEVYKNHETLLKACRRLQLKGINDFRVIFTIDPKNNAYARKLQKASKELPVSFIGNIDYRDVWDYYDKTVLVFPSYLETCGLPLLEARSVGAFILASDLPFGHEALDGYPNAAFFPFNDDNLLSQMLEKILSGEYYYQTTKGSITGDDDIGLMESMLRWIEKYG